MPFWGQAVCLSWWAGGPAWQKTANTTVLCTKHNGPYEKSE